MYKKILVPLDGSEIAENALGHLRAIARGSAVDTVVLIRVLEPIIVDVKDYIGAEHVRSAEDKLETDARKYLQNVASDLKKEGLTVETELVVDGSAAVQILDTARDKDVDLIIMSTYGRSGFPHWVFGSVTHRVLVHSPVPVLLVVPKGSKRFQW
jgi:nucleotide-binding universal stress UspA family protein